MSEPLLRLANISKTFRRGFAWGAAPATVAADDVSLQVMPGETLGIVGESGSGKSTLLRIALRLIRPDRGQVLLKGEDVWALKGARLKAARRLMQPVFQNPASSFNPRQSVRTILEAPLAVHGVGTAAERRDRIHGLLDRVGLDPALETRFAHQLSGGQKQRVAIARAVILGPALVLADEPTSALDVSIQAQVLKLFAQIKHDFGLTTVFVSHNLAVIRQVSDRVAVMQHGRVVEQGTVDEIFTTPRQSYTRDLLAAVPDPFAAFQKKGSTDA